MAQTATETEKWQGNLADIEEYGDPDNKRAIEAPVFIMFAEYLGYVTRFQKLAEQWCDGKIPDPMVQRVLIIEATCMFRQMRKDYGEEQIIAYYDRLYPIILQDYEEKLRSVVTTKALS